MQNLCLHWLVLSFAVLGHLYSSDDGVDEERVIFVMCLVTCLATLAMSCIHTLDWVFLRYDLLVYIYIYIYVYVCACVVVCHSVQTNNNC